MAEKDLGILVYHFLSLNGSNGFIITTANANDEIGFSVAPAGDFNADGIDDLIIGAPYATAGSIHFGGITNAIFGCKGHWNSSLLLSSLKSTTGFVINGAQVGDQIGYSVAPAGDLNGDGIADIIIGAPYASPGGRSSAGSSYVVFGGNITFPDSLAVSSTGTGGGSQSKSSTGTTWTGRSSSTANNPYTSTAEGISSTATPLISSATRTKPFLLNYLGNPFYLASSLGVSLFSNMNPFKGTESNIIGIKELRFLLSALNPESSYSEFSSGDSSSTKESSRLDINFKTPTMSFNEYLAIVPLVAHYIKKYSPFTLPWNKVRILSANEIRILEGQQNILRANENARKIKEIAVQNSGMFSDISQYIDFQLKSLGIEIARILDSKKTSTTQLSDISHRIQQVDKRIHELSKLNKSFKHLNIKATREHRRRPFNQTLAKIQHDYVKGTLKQEFIDAQSDEGIDLLFNTTDSKHSVKPLLFSSIGMQQPSILQSTNNQRIERNSISDCHFL